MPSARTWLSRANRALAGRLDQLRQTLATLQERLRGAIARAIGQSVAGAVQEAVAAVLDAPLPFRDSPGWGAGTAAPARPFWREAEGSWDEDREDWYDGGEEESPAEPPAAPVPGISPTGWQRAWWVGLGATTWWLRRWTGCWPVLTALVLGLCSAAVNAVGGPLAAAGIGLAGSVVSLWALSETVTAGETLLAPLDTTR
jgi:hypothetical protein